jgi:hypothetical protein
MIVGFGAFAIGYSLVYWGASHFCNCLKFCWGGCNQSDNKDCCQRYSLLCLTGLSQLLGGTKQAATQATQPEYLPVAP